MPITSTQYEKAKCPLFYKCTFLWGIWCFDQSTYVHLCIENLCEWTNHRCTEKGDVTGFPLRGRNWSFSSHGKSRLASKVVSCAHQAHLKLQWRLLLWPFFKVILVLSLTNLIRGRKTICSQKRGMLLLQRSNGVRKTCWCPMWKIELKRLFLLQVCDFLLCLHLLQHCHWALSLNANNVTWEQLLFCATQQFILTENEREKSAYPWFCITLCLILPHHCPMRLDLFFLEKMCCNLINKMSFHIKNIICTTKCNLLYSHLHISHSHEPCLSCFGHFKWRYQAFHTPSQIFLSLEWVRKTIGNISVYTNSGQLWYQSSNSIK